LRSTNIFMKGLVTLALVAAVTGAALGHDLFPPVWRGEPRTCRAVWDDWTGYQPCDPDQWESVPPIENPLTPYAWGNGDRVWDGQTWVVRLDSDPDKISFWLPNYPRPSDYKLARVQVTYANLNSPNPPVQWPDITVTGDGISNVIGPSMFDWTGTGYVTAAYDFEIIPNPEEEAFHVAFTGYPAYVDQVVIDTWCVPEPAMLSLLGIGGLGLLRRKR